MKHFAASTAAALGISAVSLTGSASGTITSSEAARLAAAAQTVQDVRGRIPENYWDRARCVAVIPELKKAAFLSGGEYGRGVMSCRSGDGWSAPVSLQLARGSWGFQPGAEIVDLVLLVMNETGVQKLLENKVALGAGVSVAAGPVASQKQAGTDSSVRAEILSYSRAQGLFAGVDITGGVLRPDDESNRDFYGPGATPRTILASRAISAPVQASAFLAALPSVSSSTPTGTSTAYTPGGPAPSVPALSSSVERSSSTTQESAPSAMDRDLRRRIADMQQTLDRLLSEAVQSPVGTTSASNPPDTARVTVDRARLLQLRQQLDALLAALDRK